MGTIELDLQNLEKRHSGVSEGYCKFLEEAVGCAVSIASEGDSKQLIDMSVDDSCEYALLVCKSVGQTELNFHSNRGESVEFAAYAVAIEAITTVFPGTRILGRTAKGTGADFWIKVPGVDGRVRMEVSGSEAAETIDRRLRQKIQQVKGGNIVGPAYVVVVHFTQGDLRIATVA